MHLVTRIRLMIRDLTNQQFYQLLLGGLAVLITFSILFSWFYYRTINKIYANIELINEQRSDIKKILGRAQRVSYQKKEVDKLLAQDKNFKIKGYLQTILTQLNLWDKKIDMSNIEFRDDRDGYIADTIKLELGAITMKELTELLQVLEKNPRLYLKNVEIKKSKKTNGTIDTIIGVATLLPIVKQPATGESSHE